MLATLKERPLTAQASAMSSRLVIPVRQFADEERTVPHSADAERAVLGGILLQVSGWEEALESLQPSDFFLRAHSAAFAGLQRLVRGGHKPDLISLNELLRHNGEVETAGGIGYIAALIDCLPRVFDLSCYTTLIKQKAKLRLFAKIADAIQSKALGANGSASEVLGEIGSLSALLRDEVAPNRFRFRKGAELARADGPGVEWLLQGYIPLGCIVELAAKVKAGKSTLIMHAAKSIGAGEQFLGVATTKSPTVYLTEQPQASFLELMQRSALLDREDFVVLFYNDCRGASWPEIAAAAVAKCKQVNAGLLVVDTLPQFAGLEGDSENNAGDALKAMKPLQRAAAENIAVVVVRHERKSGGDVEDSGRGSSAFSGVADIILSLRKPQGNAGNMRILHAVSRFATTTAELAIELTDSGYVSCGQPADFAIRDAERSILSILPDSEEGALKFHELESRTGKSRRTLQRALKSLESSGKLLKTGKGRKGTGFRYFVPTQIRLGATPALGEQKQ